MYNKIINYVVTIRYLTQYIDPGYKIVYYYLLLRIYAGNIHYILACQ